ncbi:helix-turn-helix transcriptional regulator [Streptomyces sp. NRRL F-5630]|uniref:helix-turn-helix transcriptional regulator n=1 Tax=Streptomyces sp. NRRL F-5630 TaxID=1463864 RepID=UPI003EB9CE9D
MLGALRDRRPHPYGSLEAAITQETLAERSGLDRKTVVRIEGGTHSTLLDHLLLIARALGRPLADLVRSSPGRGRTGWGLVPALIGGVGREPGQCCYRAG